MASSSVRKPRLSQSSAATASTRDQSTSTRPAAPSSSSASPCEAPERGQIGSAYAEMRFSTTRHARVASHAYSTTTANLSDGRHFSPDAACVSEPSVRRALAAAGPARR